MKKAEKFVPLPTILIFIYVSMYIDRQTEIDR